MLDIGDRFVITAPGYKAETMEVVTIYDNATVAVDVKELERGHPEQHRHCYFAEQIVEFYLKQGYITKLTKEGE